MKYIISIFLFLFALTTDAQIIISGKIKNYDGKSTVGYHPLVDGVSTSYWNPEDKVTPGLNGSFKITMSNKGFGTTSIGYQGLTYYLFLNENSKVVLNIDQAKIHFPERTKLNYERFDHIQDSVRQLATISIDGDFAEINRYYNSNMRSLVFHTVNGPDYSHMIKNAKTPKRAVAIIDSLTQGEFNAIDLLGVNAGEKPSLITDEIRQFMKNEVKAFYGEIFLGGMELKRYRHVVYQLMDSSKSLVIYSPEWEALIDDYLSNVSKSVKPSANSRQYNNFIRSFSYTSANYHRYEYELPSTTNDEDIVNHLLKNPAFDSLLLDKNTLLAYKLDALSMYLNMETFFSPVLLSSINKLKAENPNSKLLASFEPRIEKLKGYLKTNFAQYDKAKVIETNYIKFSDLLETFKGKNVLIDVWATWCGPCVEDFAYKSSLKKYIDDGSIVTLYISIDQERWEKKWKENMKYNQLEGYHVLAKHELILSMWEYLGGKQGQIPRYALINKEGKMVLNDAARPSEGNMLAKQIGDLISK